MRMRNTPQKPSRRPERDDDTRPRVPLRAARSWSWGRAGFGLLWPSMVAKKGNGERRAMDYPGPAQPPRERPELTVVIPAYNEARRLAPTLERIRDYMVLTGTRCELLIMNDGSTDETAAVIEAFNSGPLELMWFRNDQNQGKGHAVRQCAVGARGKMVLVCDADMSTPIEDLDKLRPWLEQGYDVVIGSRDMPDSQLDPPQPLGRRLMAWAFRALRRRLLLPQLRDTQCGFKLFRDIAAADIFRRQTIDGWLFDCEVLGIADRLGYGVKEVGVVWRNNPDSRVKPLREALRALPTLLSIRRRLARLSKP